MTHTFALSACLLSAQFTQVTTPIAIQDPDLGRLFVQQGGQQGRLTDEYDGSVQALERALATYLDGNEVKSILTPGEFNEWKLDLKAGQVVIAEARSDAFDPGLEMADASGKILRSNDDRYPGDQRPLLLWHCPSEGSYSLRVRCFQDKSGGQFFLRVKVYDSIDLNLEKPIERDVEQNQRVLLRLPLKAGQIRQITLDRPNNAFVHVNFGRAISPLGLPDINLTARIGAIVPNSIMAPVDGDYYVMALPSLRGKGKMRVGLREFNARPMNPSSDKLEGTGEVNAPNLWTFAVKKGQALELTAPELSLDAGFILAEQPDLTKYDLKIAEKNPFFPDSAKGQPDPGPLYSILPGRARDPRRVVFVANRDATIWLASNGASEKKGTYLIRIGPAPSDFAVSDNVEGTLRIGNYDYWSFDAKAGDVMTFALSAVGFAYQVVVRDPDLAEVHHAVARIDQTKADWNMIIRKPGRYLVSISALGDGGAGAYRLGRKVFSPREFSKSTVAKGNFSTADTEIWKFAAKPDQPVLVHWKSPKWNYSISVCDENGNPIDIPVTQVDGENRYGVLKVDRPTTFVIVLSSREGKSDYTIELLDLPGIR